MSLSPADTDVLLVLTPGGAPQGEAAVITQRFFSQMPRPAVRVTASSVDELPLVLQQARERILLESAVGGPVPVETTATHGGLLDGHGADGSTGFSADGGGAAKHHGHGDSTAGDADADADADVSGSAGSGDSSGAMVMSGNMDMDMDMDMSPGGVPLAGEADDRDGLSLDVLHLGLGPALPWWPAGLRVEVTMQGDVISAADARIIAAHESPQPPPVAVTMKVGVLDAVCRLLFLAGDDRNAAAAVRLRDQLLLGAAGGAALSRLAVRVRRSALLRSMLRRVPLVVHPGGGVSGPLLDVWSCVMLLLQMLEVPDGPAVRVELVDVELLPELLIGRELAEVRLIIAAMGSPVSVTAPVGR